MKNTNIIFLFLLLFGMVSCKEKTNNYDASGSFEATETIIAAETSGKILQLNIEEGQQLDSGQLIGFIDSTQLHLSKLQLDAKQKSHTQRQARRQCSGGSTERQNWQMQNWTVDGQKNWYRVASLHRNNWMMRMQKSPRFNPG